MFQSNQVAWENVQDLPDTMLKKDNDESEPLYIIASVPALALINAE
jgi:hypothetical protein